MRLKIRRKKAERFGPWDSMKGEIPGFSLCLLYPRMTAEEAGNLETPRGVEQNRPSQLYSLKTTYQERDSWQDRNLLDSNHSAPHKRITIEKMFPNLYYWQLPRLPMAPSCIKETRLHNDPCWRTFNQGSVERGLSHHPAALSRNFPHPSVITPETRVSTPTWR